MCERFSGRKSDGYLVHDFRGAHKDKIALQDDKLQEHDRRLLQLELEQHTGLATV